MDGSSAEKGGVDATYLNCFTRSLVFRRIASLRGLDSGTLFLKTIIINYVIQLAIITAVSLIVDSFNLNVIAYIGFVYFALGAVSIPLVLTVPFVFNLFLNDNLMRIANIFHFSGAHLVLSNFFVMALYTYKICIHRNVCGKIAEDPAILWRFINNVLNLRVLTDWEREFVLVLNDINFTVGRLSSILNTLGTVTFVILLVRNIRALSKK